MAVEELSVAELKARLAELEAEKEIHDGIAEGKVQCVTHGCTFGERTAKFRRETHNRYFKDPQGNMTDRVENSTDYWHLLDEDLTNCPTCEAPLNHLHPGAKSVFPQGYRFQFRDTRTAPTVGSVNTTVGPK
jgi:hypothetical protein